jgi:hypothetical protein
MRTVHGYKNTLVRFKLFTTASMKVTAFWDVGPLDIDVSEMRTHSIIKAIIAQMIQARLKRRYTPTRLQGYIPGLSNLQKDPCLLSRACTSYFSKTHVLNLHIIQNPFSQLCPVIWFTFMTPSWRHIQIYAVEKASVIKSTTEVS